jgi:sporulation protein YlmC with PRC-barrel domain
MTRTATPTTPASTAGGAKIAGNRGSSHGGPGPKLMSASTLEGNDVCNRADEELGEIKEIMLDVPSGRIAYAVMSAGGFLGIGDKLFAIPWSALTLDTEGKRFILDVSKDRIKNAPGFDKDHWPSMADQAYGGTLHSYYGVRPYWEEL